MIQDEVSICYLLCALTRLWIVLTVSSTIYACCFLSEYWSKSRSKFYYVFIQKPDYEVSLELGTHWPTAVGRCVL